MDRRLGPGQFGCDGAGLRSAVELDERWARNYNASQKRLWLKEQAVAHLGGKCQICDYGKSLAALEFHHRDPKQKDFEISSKESWAAILPELQKVVLLCSNCHREVHAGLHPQLLNASDADDMADVWDAFSDVTG